MKHIEFLSDYKDNKPYRLAFGILAKSIFSIDFEKYYESGYWSDNFICFTGFDNGKAVVNVSASKVKLVNDGSVYNAIQLGTVMTHPQYRGQGLAAGLISRVMAEYKAEADLFHLFANRTVLDFYPKYGFSRVRECIYSTDMIAGSMSGYPARQLDTSKREDLELLDRLASERVPVSDRLGVASMKHLTMFHSLFSYSEDLYYLKDVDAVIICGQTSDTLHIYDVICNKQIDFNDFINAIDAGGASRVQFHYTPDYKDIECKIEPYEPEDDIFFVKSNKIVIPDGLYYPETAHA